MEDRWQGKNFEQKNFGVCLLISRLYIYGVRISLSKDVNTEIKRKKISLALLYGCER